MGKGAPNLGFPLVGGGIRRRRAGLADAGDAGKFRYFYPANTVFTLLWPLRPAPRLGDMESVPAGPPA